MTAAVVERVLGSDFRRLHPMLQALHRHGGTLEGDITLRFGSGVGRHIGRAMARRAGVPPSDGAHRLRVVIRPGIDQLEWNRCFDDRHDVPSTFTHSEGLWVEQTGALRLGMTVSVVDGGWHWKARKAWWRGLRMPLAMLPRVRAFKRMQGDRYRFVVAFAMPWVGEVLAYEGLLDRVDAVGDAPG